MVVDVFRFPLQIHSPSFSTLLAYSKTDPQGQDCRTASRLSGFLLGSEPEMGEEREVGYLFSGFPPWEAAVGWLSPSAEATDGSAPFRWPCLHCHPCWVPQLLPLCPFSSRCVPIVARTLCTSPSFVGSLNPAHTFVKIPFIQTFLK